MTVSIIIAVKTWQNKLEECIKKCGELDYSKEDLQILILSDDIIQPSLLEGVNITHIITPISTGPVSPARKRDFALKHAKGEILAFIDDDAYPRADWLKKAVRHFSNQDIAAVCGPAVTPDNDSLMQKASGSVYESALLSGTQTFRYRPAKGRLVDDYPSCNFIIRRSVFASLGGFNTDFWPGEDTFLCSGIVNKLKKKIYYDPEVFVYHHRRPLFLPHLKQIANYALHRGYFTKRGYNPSFNIVYFFPSLLFLGLLAGIAVSLFSASLRNIFFTCLSAYFLLVLIFSVSKDLRLIFLKFFGIITSHIVYGVFFLKGLFQAKLKEE